MQTNILPDAKEKQLLDYYYYKLQAESFDEKDIFAYFILIRRFLKGDSWLLEISHLIAHRQREKGKIFEDLKVVSRISPSHSGAVPNVVAMDVSEFTQEFHSFLCEMGYAPLADKIISDILLCVYSILQFSNYVRRGACVGQVRIFICASEILLVSDTAKNPTDTYHVCLSKIQNTYMTSDFLQLEKNGTLFPLSPITVGRENGSLVITYESRVL